VFLRKSPAPTIGHHGGTKRLLSRGADKKELDERKRKVSYPTDTIARKTTPQNRLGER